jgi:hypothetical protein
MIRVNSRMAALGPPPIDAESTVLLDERLALILADGFDEIGDCVVLARFSESVAHVSVESCHDATGFEAFINHFHVEDELGLAYDDPVVLLQAGLFAGLLGASLERTYPADRFLILLTVSDSCTVRFHKLRQGQRWLAEDIETYQNEAVMTIPVPRGLHMPLTADGFAACWSEAASAFNLSARLPDLPFLAPTGAVSIAQYGRLLGTDFVPVLQALAAANGDDGITLVVIEPDSSHYRQHYSYFPGFRVDRDALADKYWAGLSHEPSGDPTGAIAYTADVVAVVGSTRTWAVWGQRDWDLVLVHSPVVDGPWLKAGVPFVSARDALADFTAPTRWAMPLTETQVSTFLRNLHERGSTVTSK